MKNKKFTLLMFFLVLFFTKTKAQEDKYVISGIIHTYSDTILDLKKTDTLSLINDNEKRFVILNYPTETSYCVVNTLTDINVVFSKNKDLVYAHNVLLDEETNEIFDIYLFWEANVLKKVALSSKNQTIQYKILKKI